MIQIKDIKITYDDPQTWALLCTGNTMGIFQCESQLVQHWLRKIKPKNLWELSAVIALVRPASLMSGFAEQYVKNKNDEKIESFNNAIVDGIFASTQGVLCYQEQLMMLGSRLAWQHLPQKEKLIKVDTLRKAVGKKNQQKILEIGHEFVEGCLHNNVDKDLADRLFDVIKNAGRYAFNLSHSIKYADIAYTTAYLKTHYPVVFYTTYLTFCKYKSINKWEELKRLIGEAKLFNIQVLAPNINKKNRNFAIEGDAIRYGLNHIKHVSDNFCNSLDKIPEITDWRQFVLLSMTDQFGICPNKSIVQALIKTGAFSDLAISRSGLLNLFDFLSNLTPKELTIIVENIHLCKSVYEFGPFVLQLLSKSRRLQKVHSLVQFLDINKFDDPAFISECETEYLGTSITATAVDFKGGDLYDKCSECTQDAPNSTQKRVACIIDQVYLTTTKNGKNAGRKMARIDAHDLSGELKNIPIFSDLYEEVSDLLLVKNTVLIDIYKKESGWICGNLQQL